MMDEPMILAASLARFFNQPLDWALALALPDALRWAERMVRMMESG